MTQTVKLQIKVFAKILHKILLSSEKAENSPPPNNWSNAELKKAHSNTRTSFREFRTQRELPRHTHLHDLERCERHKGKTEVGGFNRYEQATERK